MRAVIYKGPYEVAVEEVEDARIERPTDVLVKITSTNICGSDLDYVMLADIWPTGWRWSTRSAQSRSTTARPTRSSRSST
jgi:hypothetical protein